MKNISSLYWTAFGLVVFFHPSVYFIFFFYCPPEPVFSQNIYPVITGFVKLFQSHVKLFCFLIHM